MTQKEFFFIAVVIIYMYLALIFHINLKNFITFQKNSYAKFSFNIFE